MELINNGRELFIIEIIINYLQSVYPNIYGDKEIIRNYIKYNKLHNKKKIKSLTAEETNDLEQLNILFYGNEDGTNSTYSDLPGNYLITIRTIKQLINSTNKSIQDAISTIYSLFENEEITDNDVALNYYLNQIIIPTLLTTLDTHYVSENINTKIKTDEYSFEKYKDISIEEKRLEKKDEKEKKEKEQREKEEERKRVAEKKQKDIEQEKINQKISQEKDLIEKKIKSENDNKKRNKIKSIKKENEEKFNSTKLEILLKKKYSPFKDILSKINTYDKCNQYLLEEKDEENIKILKKLCEVLSIKENLNNTSDLNELEKLNKNFNTKNQELLNIIKSIKSEKETLKINIKDEIKKMDSFFSKNYNDYDKVFGIEKIDTIETNVKIDYTNLKELLKKFNYLKEKIILRELFKKNSSFKSYIIQLKYYYNVLKIIFANIVYYKITNINIITKIIQLIISDQNDYYFKIENDINKLYVKLLNKIKSFEKGKTDDKSKNDCLSYNILLQLDSFFKDDNIGIKQEDKNIYKKIFDINIIKSFISEKYLDENTDIFDFIFKKIDLSNKKEIEKHCSDIVDINSSYNSNIEIYNIIMYFYKKFDDILYQINRIYYVNDDSYLIIRYQKIIKDILNEIKKLSINTEEVEKYKNYINNIDNYDKFLNKYVNNQLKRSDIIENIKVYYKKIYINKF